MAILIWFDWPSEVVLSSVVHCEFSPVTDCLKLCLWTVLTLLSENMGWPACKVRARSGDRSPCLLAGFTPAFFLVLLASSPTLPMFGLFLAALSRGDFDSLSDDFLRFGS